MGLRLDTSEASSQPSSLETSCQNANVKTDVNLPRMGLPLDTSKGSSQPLSLETSCQNANVKTDVNLPRMALPLDTSETFSQPPSLDRNENIEVRFINLATNIRSASSQPSPPAEKRRKNSSSLDIIEASRQPLIQLRFVDFVENINSFSMVAHSSTSKGHGQLKKSYSIRSQKIWPDRFPRRFYFIKSYK